MDKRLFIISNSLPVIFEQEDVLPPEAGLVTAINSYLIMESPVSFKEVIWAGYPGIHPTAWSNIPKISQIHYSYLPIFLNHKDYDSYYHGHAKGVIWPLFHYFPSYAEYDYEHYEKYRKVNEHFAEALLKKIRPSDTVWIHDYHLIPLAGILRKEIPELTIGFFLHIPFPSFEIFRLLPRMWQEDLLRGMLGADLIGFQTIDYASHFLQSALNILGIDNDHHILHYDNRVIKVDVFPMSIDYSSLSSAYIGPEVVSLRETIRKQMQGKKMIFSIDHLDYTKGIQNRLLAYQYFLDRNPVYREKVVFVLVINPQKELGKEFLARKKIIDELVIQVNNKARTESWVPVICEYRTLNFVEALSLFTISDVALITPLRDGMNLISKQFVASRQDKKGVLIISELAGAARELTDAINVNPNDVLEMAENIRSGLEMKEEEQSIRLENMQRRILKYNAAEWAKDFINELHFIKQTQLLFQVKYLDGYSKSKIYDAYRVSGKRLLLLDYDGTLIGFFPNPVQAVPSRRLLDVLDELSQCGNNNIVLISGRSSSWLDSHFGDMPISLIAEHGARYKMKEETWVTELRNDTHWKQQVHEIMEVYVRRCANTFIEEKDFSIVWHYRNANAGQGKLRAFELSSELNEYIHNRNLQVLLGNKIVEVRQSGINKGSIIEKVIDTAQYDFIFAAGDDRTDEDMFRALATARNTFTIKVGSEASFAQYNLQTPQMLLSLLEGFIHLSAKISTR